MRLWEALGRSGRGATWGRVAVVTGGEAVPGGFAIETDLRARAAPDLRLLPFSYYSGLETIR